MAFTTVGGSGTTSASTASGAGSDLSLFTTPNTANMMFLVTVIVAGGSGVGSADVAPTASALFQIGTSSTTNPLIGPTASPNGEVVLQSSTAYFSAPKGTQNTNGFPGKAGATQHIKTIKMKVGPNTAVHVPIFNSDASTRTIYVSWNYCGVSF